MGRIRGTGMQARSPKPGSSPIFPGLAAPGRACVPLRACVPPDAGQAPKVRLDDLLEYRRRQHRQAEQAFAEMVADTERFGLYDADHAEVKAALKGAARTGNSAC
jgi:hypothetical protein